MANDYSDFCEGTLRAALATGTTTGVTVKMKQVNGTYVTWPTGAHQIMIVQRTRTQTKVEKINVASGTTQTAAGVATLGTLTRAISLTDGTDTSGTGTAQSFTQGATVYISWTTTDAEQTAKKNEANTFSAAQTVTAAVTVSGTTSYVKVPSMTEAQRDALSASNGMMVYVTDGSNANRFHQYEGGAWGVSSSTTIADGSTTVAGKFEEATVAEQGSATATGGTGARLVVANANLVKTSSGAGDENKIALLNASGIHANGFLATSGTADSTTFLRGDRVWASPSFNQNIVNLYARQADAAAVCVSSTSAETADTFNIAANSLAVGDRLPIKFGGISGLTTGTLTIRIKLGGVIVLQHSIPYASGTTPQWNGMAEITVTDADSSGATRGISNITIFGVTTDYTDGTYNAATAIDFTATMACAIEMQHSVSNGSGSTLRYFTVDHIQAA